MAISCIVYWLGRKRSRK